MVFPLDDDNPTTTKPYITVGIMIACTLVYLWQRLWLTPESAELSGYLFGVVPAVLTGAQPPDAAIPQLPPALTIVTSRQISGTESSHTILFYYSLAVVVVLGATMPTLWIQPSFHDWIWFIVVGLSGSFGQFCYNQAFRYGEASMVAPLDYLSIARPPWAWGQREYTWETYDTRIGWSHCLECGTRLPEGRRAAP